MKRVTTPDHKYHDPNPDTLDPGTIVPADCLNAMQEELSGAIEKHTPLDPANNNQLADILTTYPRRMAHFFGRR